MLDRLTSDEDFFTLLDVFHLQMQAGYEDADGLRALPIEQLDNLEEKNRNAIKL